MQDEQINNLVERFLDGETTLAEEKSSSTTISHKMKISMSHCSPTPNTSATWPYCHRPRRKKSHGRDRDGRSAGHSGQ